MRVMVTGADGFLGKNLCSYLDKIKEVEIISFTRRNNLLQLPCLLENVDFVFHLAGANRPRDQAGFVADNIELTEALCNAIADSRRRISIIYASSTQAILDNPYGISKRNAENVICKFQQKNQITAYIFRLPNIFGKWSRPNYNSVVATYCHNLARNIPIEINDPATKITLVYVDDVVDQFIKLLNGDEGLQVHEYHSVLPQYTITIGELASCIQAFKAGRLELNVHQVGSGLMRALYATYLSFLPHEEFSYSVPRYCDARGSFVEMIKTENSGQVSYFTAKPGVTRGGHFHNTKTEKFLVIKGRAHFRFRHILNGHTIEFDVSSEESKVVDTIPGWAHDITNIGNDEMFVMLWANEIFDRNKPDTFPYLMKL
ncbi:SDR family oxidoreductase [Polynucleobacter sp. 73C-SIWE]|nr:NAD-dependent epimerase/dehydratase family protein [Polynucleobacter sp. 73C-SIWE]MBU3578629.1 SDR family oxidoreductase [Polynucleobacter sp. 73C-SIWE]